MLKKRFSQKLLQGSTPNLAQMFLMRTWLSVVTFYVDLKFKMAALASDWMTRFQLLLRNGVSTKCC